ncbi:hypothetical protein HHK36_011246 [Tetracentron sinense]|uniref:NAC domain-containing protein n=1 Tax=Tetracentron sinense TaxID=13715 RepID=A0A834Z7N9_TETSI|nr:hypothetical protein HHK36_011246 [Tetracentron sinense]
MARNRRGRGMLSTARPAILNGKRRTKPKHSHSSLLHSSSFPFPFYVNPPTNFSQIPDPPPPQAPKKNKKKYPQNPSQKILMKGEASSSAAATSALAPGFRFHPTDEELVSYYLKRKICGKPFRFDAISEIDIYRFEPWDLSDRSRLKSRDLEWYFFSALDKKYGNGSRTNRTTDQGYWKTTGKDRPVRRSSSRTVGMKKTLVFHIGRAPHGERTNWVMHEYRLVDEELGLAGVVQDAFVLCRIFQKSGSGPKNGEQYGAPFIEEEWDDTVLVPREEAGEEVFWDVGNDVYVLQNDVEQLYGR